MAPMIAVEQKAGRSIAKQSPYAEANDNSDSVMLLDCGRRHSSRVMLEQDLDGGVRRVHDIRRGQRMPRLAGGSAESGRRARPQRSAIRLPPLSIGMSPRPIL